MLYILDETARGKDIQTYIKREDKVDVFGLKAEHVGFFVCLSKNHLTYFQNKTITLKMFAISYKKLQHSQKSHIDVTF